MDFEQEIAEIRAEFADHKSKMIAQVEDWHTKMYEKLSQIEKNLRDTATLNSVRSDIYRLQLRHKDSVTVKEASDRSSIPVSTLYRYAEKGILKIKEGEKMKGIIMVDDFLQFLNNLPDR